MKPNPAVPDAVWEKFISLPSQTRPQRGAKPAIRLTALAHELASDELLSSAGVKAHAAMHKFLDDFLAEREQEFAEKRSAVMTVEGRTIVADMQSGETRDGRFQADADDAVVGDAYRRTARIVSPDIARTYTEARAKRKPEAEEDFDDALIEACEDVAALHLLENLQILFDAEAKRLSDEWFSKYRKRIKKLPDDRQEAYRQITALSIEPQDVDLALPVSRFEPTTARERDGSETVIDPYEKHLLCDEHGSFPAELGSWEEPVVKAEMKRNGFKFWYRNPKRPSQDSLGIAYRAANETRVVRPDFLFFVEQDGKIVADIVDPHGFHLADSWPKLRGLAQYAETHSHVYRRIEAVAKVGEKFRVLDLTRADVRQAVLEAESAEELYKSEVAGDYT